MAERLRLILPYLVVLAVAGFLWMFTGSITYDARPGSIGPDFWPRVAIGLMAAAACYEIVRLSLRAAPGPQLGLEDVLTASGPRDSDLEPHADLADRTPDVPRSALLLAAGTLLTLGYAVLVSIFGFILSTFLFLVAFMYIGRYRNHVVIWTSALVGTLVFALIFLKVVYVSLPRGVPPFDTIGDVIVGLF